jgi:CPA2 family monovalent cation:H+ antiporter-2
LLLAFVVLAKFLGTEMILGAFLAGAVLSLLSGPGDEQTRRQLEAIGFGFFVPIFFISVGIQFDFPALLRNPTTWLLTPLFLGAAVLLKLVPTLLWRLSFSWRETLAAGALLSARLSLIIAASDIGLRLGVLDEPTHAGFILIAAVTSTLSPLLFNRLLPGPGQRGESLIAILGTGDLASQVTRELELNGETVRFLSYVAADREFEASPADSPGGQTGPVTAPAEPVNFTAFKSLLVLGSDDERNKEICREAIRRGLKHVVAFVHDPVNLAEFQDMGVQPFSAVLYRAPLLALMARNPALFSLLTSARVEHRVREIRLGNRRAAGRLLRRLDLGSDILVLAVRRNAEMIIPHGNSRLELGDYLTVLGHEDALQKLADRLEGKGS